MNYINKPGKRPGLNWFPANLPAINRRLEGWHPQDILRWGLVTFGEDMALATGFGPSGIVLMHMAAQLRTDATIFYLQTDLFFPETLALRDVLAEKLAITFTEVHSGLSLGEQAHRFGPRLWESSPDLCCSLRKVEPLRRFLAAKKAWVTAIRRDQSPTRANAAIVSWDNANHLLKLCPLAGWTSAQVWAYIEEHDLPYNTLHDQGYPSIGCMPCTRPVGAGGQERDGRWVGTNKLECGIHIQPDGTVMRLASAPTP